jgi:hypothetical protein
MIAQWYFTSFSRISWDLFDEIYLDVMGFYEDIPSHGDGMGEKNLESHQRNQHVSREVIESKGPVSRGFHGDERRILHPLAMTNSSPW